MKWILVDAGNDADWQKLRLNGIDGAFYPLSDPPADVRRRLAETRLRGLAGGVFAAWNWHPTWAQDGHAFAGAVSTLLEQVEAGLPGTGARFPKVQLDHEEHEPAQILAMLQTWRAHRPTRDTSWTMEGMQGGWMGDPAFRDAVLARRVRLVPQGYRGAMAPIELRDSDPAAFLDALIQSVYDSRAVVEELTSRGYPPHVISPYYDAAFMPGYAQGYAFTMGRLPT